MAICYDKLWKLLIDKKMNRTELKEASGISFNVLARMGKNEPVSFESIEKICFTLNCKIEDVVEIQKDEPIQIDSDAFTTIELFAGAGGLALGIEKAGFEPLGLIEFDKDAAESLKTNRPNWRVIHDDIANISCLDLEDYFGIKKGDLDLLSGGAPCQAFSYAGKRLGLEDARGTLFYHYATFLQKLQPLGELLRKNGYREGGQPPARVDPVLCKKATETCSVAFFVCGRGAMQVMKALPIFHAGRSQVKGLCRMALLAL